MTEVPVLYYFQNDVREETRKAMLSGHRRIVVQSPTGSGKTMMFAKDVYEASKRGKKCLIITDRIELLNGSNSTLLLFNIKAEAITSGMKYPPKSYQHCVAMSQTLRLRISDKKWENFFNSFDLVIIDEAHIQEFNIYFTECAFKNNPYVLAYTATPYRSKKQRSLAEDYTYLVHGPQVPLLIKEGFLVKDKYYAPKYFDVTGLELNSFGDYKESQMFKKFEETISYQSVVKNWVDIANDTITICFCVNIEHTLNTCMAFNAAGIKSKFIVSPLSKPKFSSNFTDEQLVRYKQKVALYEKYEIYMALFSGNRDDVIAEWRSGKFKVLINTGIYTKGFDYKAISTVITYRSTTSISLWLQMLGRGSRPFPGKDHFIILDFGSNAERLGMYNQEREFSLFNNKNDSSGVAPVKECGVILGKKKKDKENKDGCGCLILATRKICNYCGYIFEQEKVEIDINLVHIEYSEDKFVYNGIDFVRLERKAEERGYKQAWIINNIISEGGIDAIIQYSKYKKYSNGWIHTVEKIYEKQIEAYNKKMLRMQQENKEKQLLLNMPAQEISY